MKKIYVNNKTLQEAVDYLNNDITFFGFLSHTKTFLKELLVNPINADVDDYLKDNGLDRKTLLGELMGRNIIEKETKIENNNGVDRFMVSYKIPKRNFERKMRRLYISLFEKNEITESKIINETDCGGVMQSGANNSVGGSNPDAGQFITPLKTNKKEFPVQRRRIYVTNEQINMLKETSTNDTGDYQYDVPLNFNNGNDPAYNHQNMIAKGVPNKKIGIREKRK